MIDIITYYQSGIHLFQEIFSGSRYSLALSIEILQLNFQMADLLKEALVDFWHMIWQEKPRIITDLQECSKAKCEQYWPTSLSEDQQYGPFCVSLLREEMLPNLVIRSLAVQVLSI